jgi:hypothetical protein
LHMARHSLLWTRQKKIQCDCCGRIVAVRTAQCHRAEQAPQHIKATTLFEQQLIAHVEAVPRQQQAVSVQPTTTLVPSTSLNGTGASVEHEVDRSIGNEADYKMGRGGYESDHASYTALEATVASQFQPSRALDDSDDDSMEGGEDSEGSDSDGSMDDDSEDDLYSGLSAWDALGENFECELVDIGQYNLLTSLHRRSTCLYRAADQLSDVDHAILRAFTLKLKSHMTIKTFEMLPFAFPDASVSSFQTTSSRAAFLSGIQPVLHDCCPNSCLCLVGCYEGDQECHYCHTARYGPQGRARKKFAYVPLIPRLITLFKNRDITEKMKYRAHAHIHTPNAVNDIFDGDKYRLLLGKLVTVDGRQLHHNYFFDPRDIALGLSTDSFAPFRKRKQTAWPLIMFNYNLPPEITSHISCVSESFPVQRNRKTSIRSFGH